MTLGKNRKLVKGNARYNIPGSPFSNVGPFAGNNSKYTQINKARTLHFDYGDNNSCVLEPLGDKRVTFIVNPAYATIFTGETYPRNIYSSSLDTRYILIGNDTKMTYHEE